MASSTIRPTAPAPIATAPAIGTACVVTASDRTCHVATKSASAGEVAGIAVGAVALLVIIGVCWWRMNKGCADCVHRWFSTLVEFFSKPVRRVQQVKSSSKRPKSAVVERLVPKAEEEIPMNMRETAPAPPVIKLVAKPREVIAFDL